MSRRFLAWVPSSVPLRVPSHLWSLLCAFVSVCVGGVGVLLWLGCATLCRGVDFSAPTPRTIWCMAQEAQLMPTDVLFELSLFATSNLFHNLHTTTCVVSCLRCEVSIFHSVWPFRAQP